MKAVRGRREDPQRRIWRLYRRLPRDVRRLAGKAYKVWQQDPFHPSLHFKKVGDDLWSVRVGAHHRAIGRFHDHRLVWSWIGTHADYDRML